MLALKGLYFVTGTDTEIGKTYVTAKLLNGAKQAGLQAAGLKPVASGAIKGINEDALQLLESSSLPLTLRDVNPICFEPAIAPHIAAVEANQPLTAKKMIEGITPVMSQMPDLCLIEGAGGWAVPLNETETWRDFVHQLDVPVIMVVGMRLGCINHAILTERAIIEDGCVVHGWIANRIDPNMSNYQENLATLKQKLHSNFLCEVP